MNAMRLAMVALMACVFGVGARADEKPDIAKLIVGKWTAIKTDAGTLPEGTIVEFTKDGKVSVSAKKDDVEAKFDGIYKVEGDSFSLTMKLGEEEKTQKITVTKISDTEMHTTDKDGKVANFKRTK